MYLQKEKDETWDWQAILYVIEDLLGGSAAVSNITMRILGHVLSDKHVYAKLRQEVSMCASCHMYI